MSVCEALVFDSDAIFRRLEECEAGLEALILCKIGI
jgi:hypothetical protein